MVLLKYKHTADRLYREFEQQYMDKCVDIFSCYKNNSKNCTNCETTFEKTFLNILSKIDIKPE